MDGVILHKDGQEDLTLEEEMKSSYSKVFNPL